MDKRMRSISYIIILVLLIPIVILATNYETLAEESSNYEMIIWDKTTEGPIYNYYITESGKNPDEKDYRGYADGNGNIYLKGFDVASNQTLYIKPGVSIFFIGFYPNQFEVWGSIQVLGTKTEPVVFTSNKSNPEFEDWEGITINEKFSGESTFTHCKFEYCKKISSFRNCTFDNCDFYKTIGLYIRNVRGVITKAVVTNCSLSGDAKGVGYNYFEISAQDIVANDNHIEDENAYFWALSSGYVEFCRNKVVGGVPRGVQATTNSNDNQYVVSENEIIDQDFHIYGPKFVKQNKVTNGVLHLAGNQVIEENEVIGGLYLDFKWQPVVRNNFFDVYLSYYNALNKSEPIDLTYNTWGRDWYVEDQLGFELWPNIVDFVQFEPYYDKNGTLTDNDGIPNGWEINNGFDIYSDDSGIDDDDDGLTRLEEWQQGGRYLDGGCDPKNPDTDGDGLGDGFEVENGFNATFIDSDLDGMSDGWEYYNSLDPLFDDHENDPDEDELINLAEFLNGTDPNNIDSDEDEMSDGWEVKYDFDPNDNSDSDEDFDEDGWSNKEEFEEGTSPTNDQSHPMKPDNGFDLHGNMWSIFGGILIIVAILSVFVIIYRIQIKSKKKQEKKKTNIMKKNKKDEPVEAKAIKDKKKPALNKTKLLSIECPECSHPFKIKQGQKIVKCPKCGIKGEI